MRIQLLGRRGLRKPECCDICEIVITPHVLETSTAQWKRERTQIQVLRQAGVRKPECGDICENVMTLYASAQFITYACCDMFSFTQSDGLNIKLNVLSVV